MHEDEAKVWTWVFGNRYELVHDLRRAGADVFNDSNDFAGKQGTSDDLAQHGFPQSIRRDPVYIGSRLGFEGCSFVFFNSALGQ